jgi:hypothetical protein
MWGLYGTYYHFVSRQKKNIIHTQLNIYEKTLVWRIKWLCILEFWI